MNVAGRFIIFNIAPDSIHLTHVERANGSARPRILRADVAPVPFSDSAAIFGISHIEQLERVYASIPKDELRGAKQLCILHSPFATTHLRASGAVFPSPVLVTDARVEEVVERGASAFVPGLATMRIERVAFLLRLNGYPVHAPMGKYAREISANVYESYVAEDFYKKITAVIGNRSGVYGGDFHTVPLTVLSVVRDILERGTDVTLVHVGALSTDVGIMRGGTLSGIRSFPRGARSFALRLKEKLAPAMSEAESLVRLYLEKSLSQTAKDPVEKVYEDVRRDWLSELVGSNRPGESTVLMPRHAILFGDALGMQLYGDLLSSEASRRGVLEGIKFESELLSPRALLDLVEAAPGMSPDVYHLVSALFVGYGEKVHHL